MIVIFNDFNEVIILESKFKSFPAEILLILAKAKAVPTIKSTNVATNTRNINNFIG